MNIVLVEPDCKKYFQEEDQLRALLKAEPCQVVYWDHTLPIEFNVRELRSSDLFFRKMLLHLPYSYCFPLRSPAERLREYSPEVL